MNEPNNWRTHYFLFGSFASYLYICINKKIMIYTDKQIIDVIDSSNSLSEAYRKLTGLPKMQKVGGGAIAHFKSRAIKANADIINLRKRHFEENKTLLESVRKNKKITKKSFIKYFLVYSGKFIITNKLKKKLFEFGLKKEQCEKCGQKNIWNNQPLTLQLDHINGDKEDNRLENLRILCPNCHSQTKTYAGKKNKIGK